MAIISAFPRAIDKNRTGDRIDLRYDYMFGVSSSASYSDYVSDGYIISVKGFAASSSLSNFLGPVVSLPECKTIGNGAFSSCQYLEEVYLPECEYVGTSTNGSGVFYNCTNLRVLSLPKCKYFYTGLPATNRLSSLILPECISIGTVQGSYLSVVSLPKCERIGAIGPTLASELSFPLCWTVTWGINIGSGNSVNLISLPECSSISASIIGSGYIGTLYLPKLSRWPGSYRISSTIEIGSLYLNTFSNDTTVKFWSVSIGYLYIETALSEAGLYWLWNYSESSDRTKYNSSYCKIRSIDLPGISQIPSYMFYGTNIEEVRATNCTTVGYSAFTGCKSLRYVSLPEATSVNYSAFNGISMLTTLDLPKLQVLSSSYNYNIGNYAFSNLRGLQNLFLSSLTIMAGFRMAYELKMASLPKCSLISYSAFAQCYNLVSLYLMSDEYTVLGDTYAFSSTPISRYSGSAGRYGSIFVPSSMVSTYKTMTNWTTISSRFVGV